MTLEWLRGAQVEPSQKRDDWRAALHRADNAVLDTLVKDEAPGVVIYEIINHINEIYRDVHEGRGNPTIALLRIGRMYKTLQDVRQSLGWGQREADIGVLRCFRRSARLALVIGAGATKDANGPTWPELVQQLLSLTLQKDNEIARILPDPDGKLGVDRYVLQQVAAPPMKPEDEHSVREILGHIRENGQKSDTEKLMHGAQICYHLFGQQLFKHVTDALYKAAPSPGPIYRAIATLAQKPLIENGRLVSAWGPIVNYNFDSLMCDALSEKQVPYAVWAVRKMDGAVYLDELARKSAWHQPIFHVHGFTPSWAMDITHIKFVFSTSQYLEAYDGPPLLIGKAFSQIIARPPILTLYLGCSFNDARMNALLSDAFAKYFGRMHYALMRWPEKRGDREPTNAEIEEKSIPYLAYGVQPIWFDDFAELPEIVRSLE